ncbi:MAG: hypothetical protein ACE5OZ_23345 [Candidatus Heimdallarchaeota archaeon]
MGLSLNDYLNTLTKVQLREIARSKSVRGYSSLSKKALIELLDQNLYQSQEDVQEAIDGCPGSAQELLRIVTVQNGQIEYSAARMAFGEKYSSSTYYKALSLLQAEALLFEHTDADCDYLVIPSEVQQGIGELSPETSEVEEEPEEEIEAKASEIGSFEELVAAYVSRSSLVELCEVSGIETHRRRTNTLVQELVTKKISPEELMDRYFTVAMLKDISEELNLPKSLKKQDLISQILENIQPKAKDVVRPAPIGEISTVSTEVKRVLATPAAEAETVIPSPSPTPKPAVISLDEIADVLDKMKIKKRGIRDEDDLERQVLGRVEFWGEMNDVPVQAQSIGVDRGKVEIPDIALGSDEVFIELKYIRGQKDIDRTFRQAVNYSAKSKVGIVLYLYDPKTKVSQKDMDTLSAIPKVRLIHRS